MKYNFDVKIYSKDKSKRICYFEDVLSMDFTRDHYGDSLVTFESTDIGNASKLQRISSTEFFGNFSVQIIMNGAPHYMLDSAYVTEVKNKLSFNKDMKSVITLKSLNARQPTESELRKYKIKLIKQFNEGETL